MIFLYFKGWRLGTLVDFIFITLDNKVSHIIYQEVGGSMPQY